MFRHYSGIILWGAVFPVGISVSITTLYSSHQDIHISYHATLVALGVAMALIVSSFLIIAAKEKSQPHYFWLSCGLLGMGIFDLFHSMFEEGNLFVWFHSSRLFLGGLLFSFVCFRKLPNKILNPIRSLILFGLGCFAFCAFSFIFSDSLPLMILQGDFSPSATFLNITGGFGFIISAIFFTIRSQQNNSREDYFLALQSGIFASAGLLYEFSSLWDPIWWYVHLLRFLAYSIGLYVILTGFSKLQEVFQNLSGELNDSRKVLLEKQEQLNSIVNNASSVIYLKDIEGRYILINKQFEKIFNLTCEEIKGKTDLDIFEKDFAEKFRENDIQVLKTNTLFELEEQAPLEDGVHDYISIKFPVKGSDGKIYGLGGISTDITYRRKAEKELKRYSNQLEKTNNILERSNKDLEDFAYIVSHDLKSPLRKIIMNGGRLKDESDKLSPIDNKYLDKIIRAAYSMNVLIEDILQYSQIAVGKIEHEKVCLNQLVEEIKEQLEDLIEGSKGTLIFKNLPRIEGSKSQLYQLFLNLIKNGFKFRRADTPPVVTLGCIENGNNTWKISVENNGIGFDDKYSKKIFEPFQRLNPQGEFEGSGVGLAICEKIVMRHGGTIRAYGKLGEAAKFVVEWPREFSNFSLEPK